jgi:hypothetical protein
MGIFQLFVNKYDLFNIKLVLDTIASSFYLKSVNVICEEYDYYTEGTPSSICHVKVPELLTMTSIKASENRSLSSRYTGFVGG